MADVVLLSLPVSPFAMAVKIALAEKGVQFKVLEEDFQKGKSEMLQQMNPVTKQVPVLIHKGNPVCESLVILEYLEDIWKSEGTQLLPDDPYQRAKVRFWANFCSTKFWDKALGVMKKLGDEQTESRNQVVELMKVMDKEWSKPEYGKPFLLGDKLCMADIVLAPIVSWMLTIETLGEFKLFSSEGEHELKRMSQWFNAVEKHPSVKENILDARSTLLSANGYRRMLKEMSQSK